MIYEVVVVGEPKPKVSWLYNHKPISVSHWRQYAIYVPEIKDHLSSTSFDQNLWNIVDTVTSYLINGKAKV